MMTDTKFFRFHYTASFSSNLNTKILFWAAKPSSSPHQDIDNFTVQPSPTLTYSSKENTVLHIALGPCDASKIRFQFSTALSRNAPITSSKTEDQKSSRDFLAVEPCLERPSWLLTVVRDIGKNAKTREQTLYGLFNFVIDQMKYKRDGFDRGVAGMDPESLTGDCGEYATLFVSMCRAAGIPARNQAGYIVLSEEGTVVEHGWAQIYAAHCGWKDIDPQLAQVAKKEGEDPKKYFLNRPDYRLTFSHGLNIDLRPDIPDSFNWDHWKQEGLPASKNTVQVLQPAFFASSTPVSFQSKIDIQPGNN